MKILLKIKDEKRKKGLFLSLAFPSQGNKDRLSVSIYSMELSTYMYKQTSEFCDTQYWRKFETSLNPSCLQFVTFCVIFKINIIVENGRQKEQKILESVITVREYRICGYV